jgi:hypothetical protein
LFAKQQNYFQSAIIKQQPIIKGAKMTVNKTVGELVLGLLGGTGAILILLGIQALANKGHWIIFLVCGVFLLVGSIFISSKFKYPVNRPVPKK